jgi:hypothetical protein
VSSRSTSLRARRTGRALASCLGGLVLAFSACTFKPHIPDQAISCATDQDCPLGFSCNAKLTRCCRPGACADAPGPAPERAPAQPDRPTSTAADAHGDTPDGGVDQGRAAPNSMPADAGDARDGRSDGASPGASLGFDRRPNRRGRWNSVTEFGKTREDAPVTPGPPGRIFSPT